METLLTSSVAGSAKNTDPNLINPIDLAFTKKHIFVSSLTNNIIIQYTRQGQFVSTIPVTSPTGITIVRHKIKCHISKCKDTNTNDEDDSDKHSERSNKRRRAKILYIASQSGTVFALRLGGRPVTPVITPIITPMVTPVVTSMVSSIVTPVVTPNTVVIETISPNIILNTISNVTPTPFIISSGILSGVAWLKGKLYVTATTQGFVGVYSGTTLQAQLTDKAIFALNYKPTGIRALNKKIYVTFSNGNTRHGFGYVDVFDPKRDTFQTLIARSTLAMPYGLAWEDDSLLVGNTGSGQIAIFTPDGEFKRPVTTPEGGIIVNDGINGLQFCRKTMRLFFVAANEGGLAGSLGFITLHEER